MKPVRLTLLFVAAAAPVLMAQPSRLLAPIDPSRTVVLKGSATMPEEPQADEGLADAALRMSGITVMMKQTAAQRAELEQFLEEQRDPDSPNYQNWLTPEQFADRFGLSRADMDKVVAWLESSGLKVDNVARSRNWVVVSGSVSQVQAAFRTEIRRYRMGSVSHIVNSIEPSIPADLQDVVLGIRGLDDFKPKSTAKLQKTPEGAEPRFTVQGGVHQLAPGDISTIYNVGPLYSRGISGTGQKLVVVGQTDINPADVRLFRSNFGLPANDPQVVLVAGSTDPGVSSDDIGEANLDLDWSGAVAPNAQIIYVNSTNIYTSVQYAIDQVLAPVISMSYGYCEPKISSSPASSAAFFRSLAQQANASGITWLVATGDSAAAECDSGASATSGLAVQLPASVPEVTAVGGTEFNEGSVNFWNTSNGTTGGSALSYIPEMVWNDTASRKSLSGGGGGASIFFTKPSWQTGPGVPNDGARDIPDVSFAASPDHDGYNVVVGGKFVIYGGTSIATPVFAGMVSLLNQSQVANGAKAGLGNINPTLYALAQSTPGIFHDVTVGDNIVPCTAGSPNCVNGKLGYPAGAGYDRATGLGSLDATNLINAWGGRTASANTTTTLSANPASILMSANTLLTATVKASGTISPAGTVNFTLGKTALGSATLTGTGGTATASLTVPGTKLAVGANTITASYAGNSSFNASAGSATVTVSLPTTVSVVVATATPNPVYQQADADGVPTWYFTVRLTEMAGVATTLTAFTFNGDSAPVSLFGSTAIPAHGTLSAQLGAINVVVPATIPLSFSGKDASGQTWTQNLSVTFYGKQLSASMVLTSTPNPVRQILAGDPHCAKGAQFYHQVNLQEMNGYGVTLTRFLANGADLTKNIASFFGTTRLAALGTLHAGICWSNITPPATLSFEVDGTDVNNNKIIATASIPFQGPASSSGALSVSKPSLVINAEQDSTATVNVSAQVPASEDWAVSIYPNNQTTSWLLMSPLGATGPTNVSVTASAVGLSPGVYTANVVFQSVNTSPQFVNVPVTLVVGNSSAVKVNTVSNAASFAPAAAPGGYIAINGTGLAPTSEVATVSPLPYELSGVSATVNGVPAPIEYISATQLNVQVPYETPVTPLMPDGTADPAGFAVLGINNNGKVTSSNFQVFASAPGLFVGNDGAVVPQGTASRGGSLFFYITGEGDVSPAAKTGTPPAPGTPADQFPKPLLPASVTIGGVPAEIEFIGNVYVGVTQINVTVPKDAPLGKQEVVVTIGNAPSKPGVVTVVQ